MSEILDDQQLVQLLQQGSVAAFDSLFEAYSHKLYSFALKYFKNADDAEELVQEVFVKIWENHPKIRSEHSFKSYLFTIALNHIRKYFNKKAISLRYLESLQYSAETADQATSDDYELALKKLNAVIEMMPSRRREIFIKSKLEGKSSKEVAAELDLSPGTVDNQVSEAIRFIKSHLKPENLEMLLFAFLFFY